MSTALQTTSAGKLIPAPHEWTQLKDMAGALFSSGLLPNGIKTPQAALAIALKGWELGVPPMQAFAQISVINGKPGLGAELMLARIYARYPNADIQILRREADGAEIKARRGKGQYVTFAFTPDDAKRADVLGKDSWKKWPKAMYYWRAVSDMARSLWPECLAGISHTPEELGADVDENGEVIEAEVSEPKPDPAKANKLRAEAANALPPAQEAAKRALALKEFANASRKVMAAGGDPAAILGIDGGKSFAAEASTAELFAAADELGRWKGAGSNA